MAMKNSHEVLKQAIKTLGTKSLAIQLNISPSLIYKWCECAAETEDRVLPSGAVNPLDRIKIIYDATKDDEIVNWVCEMADGYFVKNAQDSAGDYERQVLGNIKQFIKEFSDTLDAISHSYSDDQRISPSEAKKIREQWQELKRIGEGFVKACELGKFAKVPGARKKKDPK